MQSADSLRFSATRRAGAFTLVEMLVTVACIAVLAALLLPALISAKERGRRVACLNNQHEFYLTLVLYAHDHNDRLAPGYSDLGERQVSNPAAKLDEHVVLLSHRMRTNLINTAGGNYRFLVCPGLGDPFNRPQGYDSYQDYGVIIGYTYLGGHSGTPWEPTVTTTNQWISPQKLTDNPGLPLLADLNAWSVAEGIAFAPHAARGPVMRQGDSRIRTNLSSEALGAVGGNVTVLDGSAAWKPIWQMKTYRGSRLFSEDGAFAMW